MTAWEAHFADGTVAHPYGEHPLGMLYYGDDGRMMVQIINPDRPRFADDNPLAGTDAEIRAAFNGLSAYFGRYEVDQTKGVIVHRLDGAWFPNWIGRDLPRYFNLDGDTLTLSTDAIDNPGEGNSARHILRWQRNRTY